MADISQKNTSIDKELQKVNEQLYERNVELAIRNRTLSALRKLYEIISTALGVENTAEKLIEAIVKELKFQTGFIGIIDQSTSRLQVIGTSVLPSQGANASNLLKKILNDFTTSLADRDNFCAASIRNIKVRMTNDFNDILTPFIDKPTAQKIQEIMVIQTAIVYPIIFAGVPIGVLMLGMDKHVGSLSKTEYEILKELVEVFGIALERAQIYADLKVANERLKELDILKDEFVSIASHELRTPMTAIKSYLWLALYGKEPVTGRQELYLTRSYSSVNRLIKLVNDMLNVSHIESGRIALDLKEIQIDALVKEVIDEVKPRADDLGLKIVLHDAPSPLPSVIADDDKIKEVLINLMGNSLKFTPKDGAISISFAIKDDFVETSVKDMGEGIDPQDISKLFRKFGFVRGSYATNQKASQGTGLGLYISKSIVEFHGGVMSVFSEGHGKGATFTFTLKKFNAADLARMQEKKKGKEGLGIIHSGL